jgi:NOL1/NOP2/sun family putative RNA methylase
MAFTGKSHDKIVQYRQYLHSLAVKEGLNLIEQFIGVEEKELFETHGYMPLFILEKDLNLIKRADIIIADFTDQSLGRDCEVFQAKELYGKRIISIVPNEQLKNHPYLRLFSNYIVDTPDEAFKLCHEMALFSLSPSVVNLSREQKDMIDEKIDQMFDSNGGKNLTCLLPTELKRRWKNLFKNEYEVILNWSFRTLPTSVRLNTQKYTQSDFENTCRKYSWSSKLFDLSNNIYQLKSKNPTNRFDQTDEYSNGMYYIQDLASMLPPIALGPQPGENVLDLCAAPGSKTTQIAELMKNSGNILAVDISNERLDILNKAIDRMGYLIVKPILEDGRNIGKKYSEQFDRVLVDGPCSCEGIIRYRAHKFFEWDLFQISKLTDMQFSLLESGFNALKPGGVLVYSTCTFGPEENEGIIDLMLEKYITASLVTMKFNGIKTRKGLTKWGHLPFDPSLSKTIRIYPQDNNTIGFFIAKIIKNN